MGRYRITASVAVGGLLLLMEACAAKPPPPPPPPTVIKGALEASSTVNLDIRGRASPIVVKLFELKTVGIFESADFFALFEREREALGAELVGREEFQLLPGERQPFRRQLQPDTRYLGVVAAYRELERTRWRASMPVPLNQTTSITVQLEGSGVAIRGE
jgi:type VI secretion system protein VasD